MKKAVVTIVGMLLLGACETVSNTEKDFEHAFIKTYGIDGDQQAVDMLVNDDGTIFLLGTSTNEKDGDQIYLVKVDSMGNKLWGKVYGTSGNDVAVDIERAADETNAVILGNTRVSDTDTDVQLIEIDPDGETVRQVVIGFSGSQDIAKSVTVMSDGRYWGTGSTNEQLTGSSINALIFKLNSDLTLPVDNKTALSVDAEIEYGIKIVEEPIGSYKLFSYVNRGVQNNENDFNFSLSGITTELTRTDGIIYLPDGDTDGLVDDVLASVDYRNNKFALIGTSQTTVNKVAYVSAFSITSPFGTNRFNAGNEALSLSALQGNFEGVSITHLSNGGFLALLDQEITIISGVARNIALVKLNSQGRPIWETSFGSAEFEDFSAKVAELPDGKILVLGTFSIGGSQLKMGLIKLNSKGEFLK